MLDAGGGGGAMYAVQIESLEEFQQKLTTILQSLEQDNATLRMSDGSSTFGDFPEAKSFSTAYEQAKQDLVNSFNEVTRLVNTMINVVGANANKYKQSEQDITAKFNAILQQYGDTSPTPTTATTPTPTTVPSQNTPSSAPTSTPTPAPTPTPTASPTPTPTPSPTVTPTPTPSPSGSNTPPSPAATSAGAA